MCRWRSRWCWSPVLLGVLAPGCQIGGDRAAVPASEVASESLRGCRIQVPSCAGRANRQDGSYVVEFATATRAGCYDALRLAVAECETTRPGVAWLLEGESIVGVRSYPSGCFVTAERCARDAAMAPRCPR
jgi:hypothetical protein